MNDRTRISTIPLLLFLAVMINTPLRSQEADCWNSFRGNQSLTGISPSTLPRNPELIWSVKAGDEIVAPAVACNGRVVVGTADGMVSCFDTEGDLRWQFETGNMIEAAPLIHEGTVYSGNLDGSLYALDLDQGTLVWTYQTDNQISGSANWWQENGQTIILVGSYDYYLHAVDAKNGTPLWKYESDNFINGATACDKGIAAFGGCDGYLHLVDLSSGTAREKIEVATYVAGSAAIAGGMAYVGDYDGRFTCVDLDRKQISWVWEDEQTRLPFFASPAIMDDRVIIANRDKHVYCYNKTDGSLLWKYNSGFRVDASPVIAGGIVLVGNMRGDLIMISARDGSELWNYELGSAITGNPAVTRNRFYVGAGDGYLYCFGNK